MCIVKRKQNLHFKEKLQNENEELLVSPYLLKVTM